MFEHISQEQLLNDALDMVKNDVDKREGAIIWDTLSPHTIQLYELYLSMDGMLQEMFGDTASREFLIRLCRDRGIYPYSAEKAILKGEFNIDVPIGSRFSLDTLNYIVIERIGNGVFKLECETVGIVGNNYFGQLIPIEYVDGLASATLTELLIPGEDEEETESLRKRYLDSFEALAYGGNRKDYLEKVHELQGIGGVKAFRIREGIYNVKLVILDSTYNVPSLPLIETLQTAIDPVTNQGEGLGIAAIGHTVLVVGVGESTVSINFPSIVFEDGFDWEDVVLDVQQMVDDYLLELKKGWEVATQIVIRIVQLESKMLEINGIIDVQNTTINGEANNLILEANSIPNRGEITNV
ncbi:baseplate J/gp47 family protein [Solibacillus sp. MA9]|uniref:Baseplate J/gp47 family protein n=1 Tax=Solibacillus palustris TaxID=2908203 RepID=A0ABS9UBT6_9BACL|nr:baseplate J/gp47 family protein [Solibacillus sp. MA9]MCH7321792.1 baseplate J/gp47 family protein [Solibacillus sp. MA9]